MPVTLFQPQVTRIPVPGPAPYNTLVCVQAESFGGPQNLEVGKLTRWSVSVPTPFRLAGFDQRVPPQFAHSTTAFLSAAGPAKDDSWLYAVDAVAGAGFLAYDGTYYVNVDLAVAAGDPLPSECFSWGGGPFGFCLVWMTVQVTSCVLVYEPPPHAPSTGFHGAYNSPWLEPAGGAASGLAQRLAVLSGAPYRLSPPRDAGGGASGTGAAGGTGACCG